MMNFHRVYVCHDPWKIVWQMSRCHCRLALLLYGVSGEMFGEIGDMVNFELGMLHLVKLVVASLM